MSFEVQTARIECLIGLLNNSNTGTAKQLAKIIISEEASANIQQAIATIQQNLPMLINLTQEERQVNLKMGDKTVA